MAECESPDEPRVGGAARSQLQQNVATANQRNLALQVPAAAMKRRKPNTKWTHWDLNPGPSACEADVIPLHHVPR